LAVNFKAPHGNRCLPQLLRNWYNETWYRSLSDPKKALLNPTYNRPIPSLVSLNYFMCPLICSMDSPATLPTINYRTSSDLVTWSTIVAKWAHRWATSGPLLISIQNNLILYSTYLLRTKSLTKLEFGFNFVQTPKSKNFLWMDSDYFSNYFQAR